MSDLLKMYEALNDETLSKRVQGAVVKYAHYLTTAQAGTETDRAFASVVLDDPFRRWRDFLLRVVADAAVLDKITFSPDRQSTHAQAVEDSAISYVVEATWSAVAQKYTPAPA